MSVCLIAFYRSFTWEIVPWIDELIANKIFQSEYEDLLSLRLKFQRKLEKYEGSLDRYYDGLVQCLEVLQRLEEFQQDYCQVIDGF